jgi:cell division protein FtsQ
LPEGTKLSAKALVNFATLDGRNRLLGGKAVAFDMRAPGRIYARIPNRAEAMAPKPKPEAVATKPKADSKPAAKSKGSETN